MEKDDVDLNQDGSFKNPLIQVTVELMQKACVPGVFIEKDGCRSFETFRDVTELSRFLEDIPNGIKILQIISSGLPDKAMELGI